MKSLSCRKEQCPWAIRGLNDAEVLRAAREHARRQHRHELSADDEMALRTKVLTI